MASTAQSASDCSLKPSIFAAAEFATKHSKRGPCLRPGTRGVGYKFAEQARWRIGAPRHIRVAGRARPCGPHPGAGRALLPGLRTLPDVDGLGGDSGRRALSRHQYFADKIGARQGLAATTRVLLGIALIVVPTAVLMSSLGDSIHQLVDDVQNDAFEIPAPRESIDVARGRGEALCDLVGGAR